MDRYLHFFQELQRRRVFRVAAAYAVTAWLLIEVSSVVLPAFELPEWGLRGLIIALAAGFPVACLLAWAYELTADGLQRDPADALPTPDAPSPRSPARRTAFWEALLVGTVVALAVVGGLTSLYVTYTPPASHLAVLPFRVVNDDPQADALAAGLLETLTSSLTQLGQFEKKLWVVPSSEITEAMPPSAARQRFGVSAVVSGSIQFGEERIRLTLNLIDAETERQVQSRQLDVGRQGLLGLQNEATRHLARMLDLPLSSQQAARVAHTQAADPKAERLYLEGRGVLRTAASVAGVDAAIGRFARALQVDSTFTLAHAGLGTAYRQKFKRTEDLQWVDAAISHTQQALALDSTRAPVWVALGVIRSDQRHNEAAIEAFRRAIAITPGYAEAYRHLGFVYRRTGDPERAEKTFRKAIARQPEYWKGYNALGSFFYSQVRYEDAIAQYEQGLRLAPANPSLLNNVAVVYWHQYRLENAMDAFERILALDSTRAITQSNLATAYFYLGRYDEAARLYAKASAQSPKDHELVGALADAQSWSTAHRDAASATYRRAIALAKEQLSFTDRNPSVLGSLAQYYAHLQQPDSARVWLRRLKPLADSSATSVTLAFGIGELYESLGDREQARSWIHFALRQDYGWIPLARSPWLADLRTDPLMLRLMEAKELPARLLSPKNGGS